MTAAALTRSTTAAGRMITGETPIDDTQRAGPSWCHPTAETVLSWLTLSSPLASRLQLSRLLPLWQKQRWSVGKMNAVATAA